MSTKYVVDNWRSEIKACECTKETVAFVWLRGFYSHNPDAVYKQKKAGKVFSTWEEAHAELTRRADAHLNAARRQLEQAQAFAGNVRGMKPPQCEGEGEE